MAKFFFQKDKFLKKGKTALQDKGQNKRMTPLHAKVVLFFILPLVVSAIPWRAIGIAFPYTSYFTHNSSLQIDSFPDKNKVYLRHADSLLYDKEVNEDANILKGNVSLYHDGWGMFCDSAYLYEKTNSFDAMDNVSIHGDSLDIYSQSLYYNGSDRIAHLQNNVRLTNRTATLYTDELDYDRNADIAYYTNGGTIVDSLNTLTSIYGEYIPSTNEAYFENEVVLENPDFILRTNHLRHNTETKIAYFYGPTTIDLDSAHIESTRGIYDTENNLAILLDKSMIFHRRGTLMGDSLFYDKRNQFSEVFGSMELHDTINKAFLYGEYGYYDEKKEYAFATLYSYLKDYSKKDTLYIGADTLEMISLKMDTPTLDSNNNDIRLLLAYHRAKIYSKDIQGVADSMSYFSHDSIMTLYQRPFLWHDSTQLEGDTIRAFFAADTLHHAKSWMNAKGMQMLKQKDLFNQIASDSILAFFANETIKEVRAFADSVDIVYFPEQEKIHRYFGVGRLHSPTVSVFFDADTLQKALFLGPAEGALYPIEQATDQEKKLPLLVWEPVHRPNAPGEVINLNVDSMGNPLPYTPPSKSDLSRFDGSLAALTAYETIQEEVKLSQERERARQQSLRQEEQEKKTPLPPCIRRPQEGDTPYSVDEFLHLDFLDIWEYSINQDYQENSTIIPYRTIPEKRP